MQEQLSNNIPVPIITSKSSQQHKFRNDNRNEYKGIANIKSSVLNTSNQSNQQKIESNDLVVNAPEVYDIYKKTEIKKWKLIFQYIISFYLLIIVIIDIIMEIYYGFINVFGMLDNCFIIILFIKLFILCIHRNNFYSKRLALVVALIIFIGFCLKGFSIAYCLMKEDLNLLIIYSTMIVARTFGLIFIIPFACKK